MGLNFHVRCGRHKVIGMIARGHESEVLHRFYAEHAECARLDKNAVEVQADEASEQWWMVEPTHPMYTNLGLLVREPPKEVPLKWPPASGGLEERE